MVENKALTELKKHELSTLTDRVENRIKLKQAPKRIRRIAGVDMVTTRQALKVHVCVNLLSYPDLEILEEAIATDELDDGVYFALGTLTFVPLVLSVLKMLKSNFDVAMIKEPTIKDTLPLSAYIGVIGGKPALGVSERASTLTKLGKREGVKWSGALKLRGHKTPVGVVAGNHMTYKDASSLVRSCARETRMPEPIRQAGIRIRAWEREWKRINLYKAGNTLLD
jgi:deoxyinosine 3'endonuclease (endonuclease V)